MSGSAEQSCAPALVRNQSGAAALEFAIALPIFLALLFTIFEFGWAQHKLSSIRFAMESASRSLVLNPEMTQAQVESLVRSKLTGLADPDVSLSMSTNTISEGKIVHLRGAYTHRIEVPFVGSYPFSWSTTVTTAIPPG